MSKAWTTIVLGIVMVVQTLSIISDVAPSHLGDIHLGEQHSHAGFDGHLSFNDDTFSASTTQSTELSDHCLGDHCHGSHLLVIMTIADAPTLKPAPYYSSYRVHHTATYIGSLLRPPIA
jgi:hypothetical protein